IAAPSRPSAISCIPATPSARALAARPRMATRAGSGGAISGPNKAMLLTSFGAATARCWQTMVPSEWPIQCARVTPSRLQTESSVSTKRSIVSGPSTRCERALPGMSTRITRCRASAGISGWNEFVLPPRPCTQTTASPSPSSSTTTRSIRCSVTASPSFEAVLDRADAVDLDPHDVAGAEPLGRLEAHADAGHRAGGDDVAGKERDAARAGLDQRRDVEDHVFGRRVLAELDDDIAADAGHEDVHIIDADDPGA